MIKYDKLLEMATHSNILAWEILWTEERGRLQSMGLQELDTLSNSTTTIIRFHNWISD